MSGRDHHFIPQLLQRGFSAGQTRKGDHQIIVFRRGQEPFKTNTKNSFAERDFYGPPDDAVVDDLITSEEGRLGAFVTDARASQSTRLLGASDDATDFLLQTSVRVRWIRQLFFKMGNETVDRVSEAMSTKAGLTEMFRKVFERDPNWLGDGLIKEFLRHFGRLPTLDERAKIEALVAIIRANPGHLAEFGTTLPPPDKLRGAMKQATQRGHLQGLKGALNKPDTTFREFLAQMRWSVIVVSEPALILGDCAALFLDPAGVPLGPVGIPEHKDVGAVALPLSSSHVLVGRSVSSCPDPQLPALNKASARWSKEAFIAASDTPANRSLQAEIALGVDSFLEGELATAFAESVFARG